MKTALLLEGEGNTVMKDPMRTSYLEVYTDVGTSDLGNETTAITNLSHKESAGEICILADFDLDCCGTIMG